MAVARQLTGVRVLSATDVSCPEAVDFDALFDAHAAGVHRMVRRLLGPAADGADVDDVTQQVFIAAHRGLPRFRGDAQVTTWLYGIAARRVLMHLRSRRRHRALLARLEAEPEGAPRPTDALARIEGRLALRDVWRALMRLPSKKRVVFLLFEVEGWTAPEIAERLGLREGTVRSRLGHARRELEVALKELDDAI